MSFGVNKHEAFTIDVMRMPVEGTPQVKTLKTEDVNQLLMSPITSWKDTVDQLRGAPRDNVRTDYTKRTMLGQGDPFMVPFISGLENYDKQYLNSNWMGAPRMGAGLQVENINKKFVQKMLDSKLDPSIAQKETIEWTETVIFVGDIHSSYHSFIEIINDLVTRGVLKDDLTIHPEYWLVFLGDIFDRGTYGLDILNIIFQIKNKSFERVIVLNGNHEDRAIYAGNGTGIEIDTQLPDVDHRWLIHKLVTRFPTVLYLDYGSNRIIQACHGGIDPDHLPLPFAKLARQTRFQFHGFDGQEKESELVFRGLRWTDFNVNEPAIGKTPNRGLVYGIDATNAWMEEHEIAGIIRGHQDTQNLSVLPRRTKMPLHYHTHWQNSDSGLWIPTSKIPREPEDPTSFHRIPLVNAFEAFSVVTTSSAVAPRKLPYHSYLELKHGDAHRLAASDALNRIPKEQLTSATKISAEDVEYLKSARNSGRVLPGLQKTDDYCLIQELFYKLGADFDEKDAPLLPLYELLSWDPFAPKT